MCHDRLVHPVDFSCRVFERGVGFGSRAESLHSGLQLSAREEKSSSINGKVLIDTLRQSPD